MTNHQHEWIAERAREVAEEMRRSGDGRIMDQLYEDGYEHASIEADLLAIPRASEEEEPQPIQAEELIGIAPSQFLSNSKLLTYAVYLESATRHYNSTYRGRRLFSGFLYGDLAKEADELYMERLREEIRLLIEGSSDKYGRSADP